MPYEEERLTKSNLNDGRLLLDLKSPVSNAMRQSTHFRVKKGDEKCKVLGQECNRLNRRQSRIRPVSSPLECSLQAVQVCLIGLFLDSPPLKGEEQ